jgi:ribonuclease P protein subunit POP4
VAENAKKKAGIMGRREANEKGTWKLEAEQTKSVTHSFASTYLKSVLMIHLGFRFDLFVPLHRFWLGYMSELLGLAPPPSGAASAATSAIPAAAGMHAKLVKADFHGSFITGMLTIRWNRLIIWFMAFNISTVKQSKNPCLVGLSGIVIHETENAFKVVTKKNQLKRPFIPVVQSEWHHSSFRWNSSSKAEFHIFICRPLILNSTTLGIGGFILCDAFSGGWLAGNH